MPPSPCPTWAEPTIALTDPPPLPLAPPGPARRSAGWVLAWRLGRVVAASVVVTGLAALGVIVAAAGFVRLRGRPVVERRSGPPAANPYAAEGPVVEGPVVEGPAGVVVIVPGARVFPDGRLSLTLRGRLDTALDLYRTGRARSFLVSGANDLPRFGEAAMMRAHLRQRGVADEAIVADEAGVSTWATVRRARTRFGVERALFVTQHPYADRAATLARAAGLDVVVVSIDPPPLRRRRWPRVWAREALANVKASVIALSPAGGPWRPGSAPADGPGSGWPGRSPRPHHH